MIDFISIEGRGGNEPGEDGRSRRYIYDGPNAVQLDVIGGSGARGADGGETGDGGPGGRGGDAKAIVSGGIFGPSTDFHVTAGASGGEGGDSGDQGIGGAAGHGGSGVAAIRNNVASGVEGTLARFYGLQATAYGASSGRPGIGTSSGESADGGDAEATITGNAIALADAATGFRFSAYALAVNRNGAGGAAHAVISRNTLDGGEGSAGQVVAFELKVAGDNMLNATAEFSRNVVNLFSGDDTVSIQFGEMIDSLSGPVTAFANRFTGGAGTDTLVLNLSQQAVQSATINLASGVVDFGSGTNRVDGFENVDVNLGQWSGFAVQITGDELANVLSASNGDDMLAGRGGDDVLSGERGADHLNGGGGDDRLTGGLGADALTGWVGADTFVFHQAADSTGTGFDTIADANFNVDRLAFDFTVGQIAAPQTLATLDEATFDAQLAAAAAGLGANAAGVFAASGGDFAGRTFLVVDADGLGGYSAGADFVIEISGYFGTIGLADFVIA